jgi:hypothetical protein
MLIYIYMTLPLVGKNPEVCCHSGTCDQEETVSHRTGSSANSTVLCSRIAVPPLVVDWGQQGMIYCIHDSFPHISVTFIRTVRLC